VRVKPIRCWAGHTKGERGGDKPAMIKVNPGQHCYRGKVQAGVDVVNAGGGNSQAKRAGARRKKGNSVRCEVIRENQGPRLQNPTRS